MGESVPSAQEWMRIVMLMLHSQGGEATINDSSVLEFDARQWEVVHWKEPMSWAWRLKLRRRCEDDCMPVPHVHELPQRELADFRSPEAQEWRRTVAEKSLRAQLGLPRD